VIVWLNGAFGSGKTTTARLLRAALPGSRVFDPESVGFLLRDALADRPVADFREWPAWRSLVVATGAALAGLTEGELIAPQTVTDPSWFGEIADGLSAAGVPLVHVILDAGTDVLRRRIDASGEAQVWRRSQLASWTESRPWLEAEADVVVRTDDRSPDQVTAEVLAGLLAIAAR
jgi:hypothetical protein